MTGKFFNTIKREDGVVQIVEASFVFPVMFIILFFLIFMGNAHYIRAQVDSVVEIRALEGASYCGDPLLQNLKTKGSLPALSDLESEPYRYLFGGMNSVESTIGRLVKSDIENNSVSTFSNMKPELKTAASRIAKFNNYVVYSTFSVEVKYEIEFPISFLGEDTPPLLTICSRAEVPVNDTAEFIRNTDMVIDLLYKTKFAQAVSDIFGKVNGFISSFAEK